jgi:hypothetical protein
MVGKSVAWLRYCGEESMRITHLILHAGLVLAAVFGAAGNCQGDEGLAVRKESDQLVVTDRGLPVATYVFRDAQIRRPFFAHVHAPGERQVTRRHPPREGEDATDHAAMHPGVWLAFGDLGGSDFWRNVGTVEFVEFAQPPAGEQGVIQWAARFRYRAGEQTLCEELARHTIRKLDGGYLLTFDCTLRGERPFAFGDQEEMGLGVRVATPLTVKAGGEIVDSAGRKNEREVWGKVARWVRYSRSIDEVQTGLVILPHPDNFRPSWLHARDYGVLVANPFGQQAFTRGAKSRVEVKPGESLRLRFGIVTFAIPRGETVDAESLVKRYIDLP